MPENWQDLMEIVGGRKFSLERIRLADKAIAIEGLFELPPLAQLSADDQVFVAAFVRCHGSIKKMEEFFGVSYPTIKNRLNELSGKLDFVSIEAGYGSDSEGETMDRKQVLTSLRNGQVSVDEAIARLKKAK